MGKTHPENVLDEEPRYFRAPVSRGAEPAVQRNGGKNQEGLIRGLSVVTRGEALGHDLWLDDTFCNQVALAIDEKNNGAKARFTHPSLSGDGLGRHLGRVQNGSFNGTQVFADLHMSAAGHRTPEGDLAGYVMDLAEDDPEAFGMSIVFGFDHEDMDQFSEEHEDSDGRFVSPDALNTKNLLHARLGELRAVDAVDEPAANPSGLFHREVELLAEAELVTAYALGLSNDKPKTVCLGVDADRIKGFVARFATEHDLTITQEKEGKDMGLADKMEEQLEQLEAKHDDNTAVEAAVEDTVEQLADEKTAEVVATSEPLTGQAFLDAFGDIGGVWFAQGKTFDDCRDSAIEQLRNDLTVAQTELKTLRATLGEQTPIEIEPEPENGKGKGFANRIRIQGR